VVQVSNVQGLETAKKLTEFIGNKTIISTTPPQNSGESSRAERGFRRKDLDHHERRRRHPFLDRCLMKPEEILTLMDGILLFVKNPRPFQAGKIRYFERPEFAGLSDQAYTGSNLGGRDHSNLLMTGRSVFVIDPKGENGQMPVFGKLRLSGGAAALRKPEKAAQGRMALQIRQSNLVRQPTRACLSYGSRTRASRFPKKRWNGFFNPSFVERSDATRPGWGWDCTSRLRSHGPMMASSPWRLRPTRRALLCGCL
jgi:hypothetical protein